MFVIYGLKSLFATRCRGGSLTSVLYDCLLS